MILQNLWRKLAQEPPHHLKTDVERLEDRIRSLEGMLFDAIDRIDILESKQML